MRVTMCRGFAVGLLLACGQPVAAQPPVEASAQDIRGELERLRQEFEAVRQQYGDRLAALEAKLVRLEAAGALPGQPAPQVPIATTAPTVPAELAAAPTGGDQPAPGQLPVYGGQAAARLLNPDVGIIGNLISATGQSRGGSEAVRPSPFLRLQESEASFQAIVDPYARADFFLAIGEEGIEVEEGFITFPALPGGLLVKAGRFRANFGRLNAFHNHTLPWTDRPLVMYNLLGGETDDPDTGIKDAGVSVSRLIPAGNFFIEATGELFRGESGTLFQSRRRQDFSVVGRVRSYRDITESSNVEVAGSYARGHNDAGSEFLTELYGLDVTFRWKPLQRAIYRSFVARSELMWSGREEPAIRHTAFGWYASADYQFQRRWFAGTRVDWAERAREASVRDRGFSAVLTYWPSEFSQVRGQYRRTRYGHKDHVANELFCQVVFTIGAHGAHPF
jgi:hypothetical protein